MKYLIIYYKKKQCKIFIFPYLSIYLCFYGISYLSNVTRTDLNYKVYICLCYHNCCIHRLNMTVLDYFNKRIPIFCARKIDINNNINIRIIRTEYRIIPNNKFIQTIKDAAKLLTIDSI